jgi:hypothetical protein
MIQLETKLLTMLTILAATLRTLIYMVLSVLEIISLLSANLGVSYIGTDLRVHVSHYCRKNLSVQTNAK